MSCNAGKTCFFVWEGYFMNITQLRYFLKAAEHLNFAKAADDISIARQSLRQSISSLEDEIGKPLFLNTKNKLSLTEEGLYLQVVAKDMVEEFDQMQANLIQLTSKKHTLKVAYSTSLFPFIFPNYKSYIKEFESNFKNIKLDVQTMTNDEIIHRVEAGTIDIGCILDLYHPRTNCFTHPLATFDLAMSFHLNNPFQKTHINLEDLQGLHCVGFGSLETSFYPLYMDCQQKNISFDYTIVPSTLDTYYKTTHEDVIAFDLLIPDAPGFNWDYVAALDNYHIQLEYLCSSQYNNSALQKVFCSQMEQYYLSSTSH